MIASPCNRLCSLDPRTGWCLGCGRTGEEIGAWPGMTEAQRLALLALLPARLARQDSSSATPPATSAAAEPSATGSA